VVKRRTIRIREAIIKKVVERDSNRRARKGTTRRRKTINRRRAASR